MLKAIKHGFGLAVGAILGYVTMGVVGSYILDYAAKDEDYVESKKNSDPEMYETLKKHQKPKEEDSKEEEAQ